MKTDRYIDRFDERTYENDAPCIIGIFGKELLDNSCLEISERLLSRLISISQAYDLHLISLFDIYNDTYLNRQQCVNLLDELDFVLRVTNDELLHDRTRKIMELTTDCIQRTDCQLLIGGN